MASQPQSVEQLLGAALNLAPEKRRAFLDRACLAAPEQRRLVERLLIEDPRVGNFPNRPILKSANSPASTEETLPTSAITRPAGTPSPARFEPGQAIADRFVIVRFIARGGMGEVYEAEDRFLQGAHVALKMILPEIAADLGASHRFEQEVLLARKVNHPNLCPIYEIFRCQEPPPPFLFLTMKLLTGETLESRLRSSLPLPREETLEIFRQMICGIAAIHAAGVIHRDIKPNNVMLDHSGARLSVSIMDFGLARLHLSESTVLKTGMIAGTPGYLAPELLRGHRPSQASDIFALGVLLHRVVTGERPVEDTGAHSVRPVPSLDAADVPALYIQTVRDFLSDDPDRRCRAFEQIHSSIDSNSPSPLYPHYGPRLWTRRNFTIASAASICAVVGTAAWKHERIYDLLHPLPPKRFVAILGWPPPTDARVKPLLMGLIDAMASELARAEAFDHNLFVTAQRTATDMTTPAQLNEARESLGANLILATSGMPVAKELHVSLQVLDPSTNRALRSKHIRVPLDQQSSLPEKAVRAAAELLDIVHYRPDAKRIKAGTDIAEALAAFQAAEALMKQDNDTGLDAAIEKYKQAVDLDPHYAIAHAKLAVAYCRLASLKHDPAALVLARGNCDAALAFNPNLVQAHIALASVLQQTGDETSAIREMKKALSLDPADTQTIVWLAQIYARLNRWQDAENSFQRALQQRPNNWLAHNELGVVFNSEGKYPQAISEFRAANLINPKNALALNNIASVYLQLGKVPEALDKLNQSLALRPNALALATMAAALRSQGDFAGALKFAQRATDLDPGDSTTWLELGDCHSMIPSHGSDARNAYAKAARVQQEELETDATDGPGWILLGLYQAKIGSTELALSSIRKGGSLPSDDLDTQLYKARALEVSGKREDALATLAACFKRGATTFQIDLMPDMGSLKNDPRYQQLLHVSQAVDITDQRQTSFTKETYL